MGKPQYHYESARAAMNRTMRLDDTASRTPAQENELAALNEAYPQLQAAAKQEEEGR